MRIRLPLTLSPLTAYLVGASLAAVPALGPLIGAVVQLARGWRPERRDLLWLAAALAFGLVGALQGGAVQALVAAGTVAGPWVVFSAFRSLANDATARTAPIALAYGLVSGFVLLVAASFLAAVASFDFSASRTVTNAILWNGSPALFGHSVLVLGGGLALVLRRQRVAMWLLLAIAFVGILVSGSIEALAGWSVLAAILAAFPVAGSRRRTWLEAAALLMTVALGFTLAPHVGFGRIGFLLPVASADTTSPNLFTGTEVANGDWWDDRWVAVRATPTQIAGTSLLAYDVTKQGSEPWLRLQQLVRLEPGETYTLSAWIRARSDTVPSLQGWGRSGERAEALVLDGRLPGDAWSARMSGPGALLSSRLLERDGAWRRVSASFEVDPDAEPLTWFVGFAPDARERAGSTSTVAGLMLEPGAEASPTYRPGPATAGLSFDYARQPLWTAAWRGFLERPLLGGAPAPSGTTTPPPSTRSSRPSVCPNTRTT